MTNDPEIAGPAKWRERWYGSDPLRGAAITDIRGNQIVHLGGDRETLRLASKIVAAHNAALERGPSETAIERARVIAASLHPNSAWADRVMAGRRDDDDAVRAALAGLQWGEWAGTAPNQALGAE